MRTRKSATWGLAGLVASTIGASVHAGPVELYVDDDAPAGGDGASWDTAFRFLQDALGTARGGDIDEIRIAQGLYRPDHDEEHPKGTANPAATFLLVPQVALLGGYAGLGAEDPDARDAEQFVSVLSGDLLGDDGPDFENIEDNSEHVVSSTLPSPPSTMNGLTITGGNAAVGGGLYLAGGVTLVSDCIFVRNSASFAGGAVFLSGNADLALSQCTVEGNRADRGAGVRVSGGVATLDRCTFRGNTAATGGGVETGGAGPVGVYECVFIDNSAAKSGGGASVGPATTFTNCTFSGNCAGLDGGGLNGSGTPITSCTFDGNVSRRHGGGMLMRGDAPLTDCTFTGNDAVRGGGLALEFFDDAEVAGGTFTGNDASSSGGAVYLANCSEPVLTDCLISSNTAGTQGGGVYVTLGSHVFLADCTVRENTAGAEGGGLANRVGSWTLVARCLFDGNDAREGGGAFNLAATLEITDCTFRENTAIKGAALADNQGDELLLANSTLTANRASSVGGALALTEDAIVEVTACFFGGNTATARGGAMYAIGSNATIANCVFTGNRAGNSGGAVHGSASATTHVNCSFSRNEAPFGGAYSAANGFSMTIANGVLWDNGDDPIDDFSPVTVSYSNVEGGFDGLGNIDENPRFADPDGDDDVVGTADDDLRLAAGSPCIDAGDNAAVPPDVMTDFDGANRFLDDPHTKDTGAGDPPLVDHGAYEFGGVCRADLDGSGVVDFGDIIEILGAWGPCPGCPEDLDGSGVVDFADILVVLTVWGPC